MRSISRLATGDGVGLPPSRPWMEATSRCAASKVVLVLPYSAASVPCSSASACLMTVEVPNDISCSVPHRAKIRTETNTHVARYAGRGKLPRADLIL